MVRAFWRDHGSFGAFSKCPLNYNICALLYSNRGYTQYQRQVNIFLSLLFPGTTTSVSSNGLQRCARTPHATAITSCSSILYLLNNKVFSYLISANTVSVLRTQCQITSRTLSHVELLKPFRQQYVTYQVTYWILLWRVQIRPSWRARFCLSLKKRKFFFFQDFATRPFFNTNHEFKYFH